MSLEHKKFCPKCGFKTKKKSNFCNNCGLCFKLKCKECDIVGFWEYCMTCGVRMLQSTESEINNKNIADVFTKILKEINPEEIKEVTQKIVEKKPVESVKVVLRDEEDEGNESTDSIVVKKVHFKFFKVFIF